MLCRSPIPCWHATSAHNTRLTSTVQAFLEVIGAHGLQVDNCPVFPTASASPNPKPTTIPLPNNTLITIHKKHFKFSYPPKNLRPMLLSTPSPSKHAPRKALRLSMIESAKVFTPRPSKDARENLRVLQSPLKTGQPSPLKRTTYPEEPEEEEIVLVDGNRPKVIQEEKDLVIVEDVMLPAEPEPLPAPAFGVGKKRPQLGTPGGAGGPSTPRVRQASGVYHPPSRIQHSQQNQHEQFRTPQPKKQPRSSLHRAVLLRSAQRAALRAEMEVEDAREDDDDEEREVASGLGIAVLEEDEDQPEEAPEHAEVEQRVEDDDDQKQNGEEDGRAEENEEDEQEQARPAAVSGWRKSLGAVAEAVAWPVRAISRSRSQSPEKMAQEDEQDITDVRLVLFQWSILSLNRTVFLGSARRRHRRPRARVEATLQSYRLHATAPAPPSASAIHVPPRRHRASYGTTSFLTGRT